MKQNSILSIVQNSRAKYYIVFIAVVLSGLFLWQATKAATTDNIAATVTAINLSVSVSDGTIAFGTVALNAATTTAGNTDTQTVTNDGSSAQLNVKGSDATNGTTWTLNTSNASLDNYTLEVSTTTGSSYMDLVDDTTYTTASTTFDSLTSGDLDFRLTTPNTSTDFVQKSVTITVQVVAQ